MTDLIEEVREIRTLESKIRIWSQAYYEGAPIVSDEIFDESIEKLKQIDPRNPILFQTGWGYKPESHLLKSKHATYVGSLDKIKAVDVLSSNYKWTDKLFVASLKLDGGDVVCYYKDGKFSHALSRGDGTIGLNITRNLIPGESIPKYVPSTIKAVRGQVMLTWEDFNGMDATSPRNKAVGLSQSVDANLDELKKLKFIAFDIVHRDISMTMNTKAKDMHLLSEYGFIIAPWSVYTWSDWIDGINNNSINPKDQDHNLSIELCHHIPFDGMVLSINDPSEDGEYTEYESVAWKWEDEKSTTTVKDIEYNMTRTGRLVPVLIIEEVELSGAYINRVTANNVEWLTEWEAGIGSKVEIVRSNEVIPMLVGVIDKAPVVLPTVCPKCNSLLIKEGRDLMCKNTECPSKVLTVLYNIYYRHRVDGIGDSTFDSILKIYKITDIGELLLWATIACKSPDMIYKHFGDATSDKILKMANNLISEKISVIDILTMANIPGLGWASAKGINDNIPIDEFHSDILCNFTVPEYWARYLATYRPYDALKIYWSTLRSLITFYGKDRICKYEENNHEAIEIKFRFMATGSLSKTRNDLIEEFKVYGIVWDEFNPQVMITNKPSGSSKYKKAVSMGIPILTEEQFRATYLK